MVGIKYVTIIKSVRQRKPVVYTNQNEQSLPCNCCIETMRLFKKGDKKIMSRFVFSGESSDYQQRREELLAAEIALKGQVERVAALRRALPLGMRVPDYVFREGPMDLTQNDPGDFHDVHLADLFTDGHDTL